MRGLILNLFATVLLKGTRRVYRVTTVQTCDRTLPVNKTDARVVATLISSSDELHQIHHTRLVLSLLSEVDSDLSNNFICRPTRKSLFNVTVI